MTFKEKLKTTKFGRFLAIIYHHKDYKRRIKEELEKRNDNISIKDINWCYWDYLNFFVKYKGSLETDYFGTNLYLKSDFVRKNSFATGIRNNWRNAIQDVKYWDIFLNKKEFYTAFSSYLHRPWMSIDSDIDVQKIDIFLKKCSYKVISKKVWGCGGKDVVYWDLNEKDKVKEFLAYCQKEKPLVIEGIVKQCEEIYSFSKGSVNTVRIVTIIDNSNKAHVARACLRIGRKNTHIDNFSSGGMSSTIDLATGILIAPAIDKNNKEYLIHPDTKKQIVGYKIPDWENYKKFALKLASKYPTMRYVGWDIVKDDEGNFLVIEGNKDAGIDCFEASLLYGLLPIYEKLKNKGNEDD